MFKSLNRWLNELSIKRWESPTIRMAVLLPSLMALVAVAIWLLGASPVIALVWWVGYSLLAVTSNRHMGAKTQIIGGEASGLILITGLIGIYSGSVPAWMLVMGLTALGNAVNLKILREMEGPDILKGVGWFSAYVLIGHSLVLWTGLVAGGWYAILLGIVYFLLYLLLMKVLTSINSRLLPAWEQLLEVSRR